MVLLSQFLWIKWLSLVLYSFLYHFIDVQHSFFYCSAKMFQDSNTNWQTSNTKFLPFERDILRGWNFFSNFLSSGSIKRMQYRISDKIFNHHWLSFWKILINVTQRLCCCCCCCYPKKKQVSGFHTFRFKTVYDCTPVQQCNNKQTTQNIVCTVNNNFLSTSEYS
jgi:hypothetical protein